MLLCFSRPEHSTITTTAILSNPLDVARGMCQYNMAVLFLLSPQLLEFECVAQSEVSKLVEGDAMTSDPSKQLVMQHSCVARDHSGIRLWDQTLGSGLGEKHTNSPTNAGVSIATEDLTSISRQSASKLQQPTHTYLEARPVRSLAESI